VTDCRPIKSIRLSERRCTPLRFLMPFGLDVEQSKTVNVTLWGVESRIMLYEN
jgi:hypothetical protein